MGLRTTSPPVAAAFACALVAVGCGAKVLIDPAEDGAGGSGGTSPVGPSVTTTSNVTTVTTTSSTGMNDFQTYCARMEADEIEHDCFDDFDPAACLAAEGCATDILRPDASPLLLDCVADDGCWEWANQCVWYDLADIPLTEVGQAFFDACIAASDCDYPLFCYQAYWLTDAALASSAECIGTHDCGVSQTCFEQTALGQCMGWIRPTNPWYR